MKKNTTEKSPLISQKPLNKTQNIEPNIFEKFEKKNLQVSTQSVIKFWLWGLVFVFLGYLLFSTLDMLYVILTSIIIAISMEGIILTLEKKLKNRG